MIRYLFLICTCLMAACANQHPTHYYSLGMQAAQTQGYHLPEQINLGILPVKLPNMLDRPGIVTKKNGPEIQVASHHIWAGDLKENLTLTISELLAQQLHTDKVTSGPWNARFRPEYQLQIEFQKFIGKRGERAYLKAHWELLADFGKVRLYHQTTELDVAVSGEEYADYISSLDELLTGFVHSELAPAIHQQIQANQTK